MPKNEIQKIEQDFYRPVYLKNLNAQNLLKKIKATSDERIALAKRFDLISLELLSGTLNFFYSNKRKIEVTGKIFAKYKQRCIITLDQIENNIDEPISISFITFANTIENIGEIDFFSNDDIELLASDELDCGELLAQTLATLINPYPRKPLHKIEENDYIIDYDLNETFNPFQVLEKLKS